MLLGKPCPASTLPTIVSPAPDAAPSATAPCHEVVVSAPPTPADSPPTTPLTATIRGLNVPVASPMPADAPTPMRMPAPTAVPTPVAQRPTPRAVTPTIAKVPHGSSRTASHALPSTVCSAADMTAANSSVDSGRIPVGSTQFTGSFQQYV